MRRALTLLIALCCAAWSHGAVNYYIEDDGSSFPWAGTAISPAGYHVTATNTTWFGWEGWQTVAGVKQRVVEVTTKNWTTGAWTPNAIASTDTLVGDIHGVPALVADGDGYVYAFCCAHSSPMKIYGTVAANDPSSWHSVATISASHTFPNPSKVGNAVYLVDNVVGAGIGPQQAIEVVKFSYSGGALTTVSTQNIVDVEVATDGWAPLSQTRVISDRYIHMVFNTGTGIGSTMAGPYYLIYDTTTGNVSNFSGSVTVAPASQPVSLATLNASFKIYPSSYVSDAALTVDDAGASHVVFGSGSSSSTTIYHTKATPGGAWSTAAAMYTYSQSVDAGVLQPAAVSNANSGIDVYFPDGSAGYTFPAAGNTASGNMLRMTRSSSGVWSGPVTILQMTSQGLDVPETIINGTTNARVMFSEITSNSTSISGILKGYIYGDAGFVTRASTLLPRTAFDSAHKASTITVMPYTQNLTAYANTTDLDGAAVRSVSSFTLPCYFEVNINNIYAPTGGFGIGIANASQSFAAGHFIGEAGNNSIGMSASGAVYRNGSSIGSALTAQLMQSSIVGVALTSSNIWFRANDLTTGAPTVWNADGAADPATNTGGLSTTAITPPYYGAVELEVSGMQATINFGASHFAYIPPTGFNACGAAP